LAHCSTHLPEVANFQVAVLVAENVLGLYVAVHDVVLVQALQRFADLCVTATAQETQQQRPSKLKPQPALQMWPSG
jgi:hypothetical protein